MVKIRLTRIGKRNNPFYRIIAVDSAKKNNGKALSILGYWHPKKEIVKIDKKAISEWESKGAQISPAVAKLMN